MIDWLTDWIIVRYKWSMYSSIIYYFYYDFLLEANNNHNNNVFIHQVEWAIFYFWWFSLLWGNMEYRKINVNNENVNNRDAFELPPILSMLNWATLVACGKKSYMAENFAYAEFVRASLIFQTYDSIFIYFT